MSSRELLHTVKAVHLLTQTAVTSATFTTLAFDTIGFEAAAFIVDVSTWAGAGSTWTPTVTECDTSAGSYQPLSGLGVGGTAEPSMLEWFVNGVAQGTTAPVIQDATLSASTIGVSIVGNQHRFLKLTMTLAGTPTTMVLDVIGLLGYPREVGAKAYSNWNT